MSAYTDRAFRALAQFNGRLSAFTEQVTATRPDPPRMPAGALKALLEIAGRARKASDCITQSFTLIEVTSLDVVDMQVRLQGETARLASALRELRKAGDEQPFVHEVFGDALVPLDEVAQRVAAAVFPGAVQGLRDVNVKLWDFQKILWKRYTDILTEAVQRGSISSDQEVHIQAIADSVSQAFEEVNSLLNDLAEGRPSDAASLRKRLQQAPARLTAVLDAATDKLKGAPEAARKFGSVISASKKVADDIAELLRKLTIPVFPTYEGLKNCCEFIEQPLYDGLSGVQTFALLNILSRLQDTKVKKRPLLEGRNARIIDVYPDRIYLEADRSLIDDVGGHPDFVSAPASLHRFKEGSFKQKVFRKGNVQLSFATRPGNRVVIDADIDLYRSAASHLFGEVLVNHLTGNTTDQFKVRDILEDQSVASIGSFALLRV